MNNRLCLAFVSALLVVGCGGDDGGGGSMQGFTDCGQFPDDVAKTCNPGQYCADEIFSQCELGCLGDFNCEAGRSCEKAPGQDVGSCGGVSPSPDAGITPANELQRCLDACSILTSCSAIEAGEGAQCTSDCNGLLNDTQRKAFADCVGDWNCSGGIPACLGLECGPAYPCSSGSCIGGECL